MKIEKKITFMRIIFLIGGILATFWAYYDSDLSIKFIVVGIVLSISSFVVLQLASKIIEVVFFLVFAFLMTAIFQLETGSVISDLGVLTIIINYGIVLSICIVVLLVCNNVKVSLISVSIALYLFGMADALVIAFRGNQISVNDFSSLGTALSVWGNYKFTPNHMYFFATIYFVLLILFLLSCKCVKLDNKRYYFLPVILLTVGIVVLSMPNYEVKTWANQGCTRNGVLFELLLEVCDSRIAPPEGYDDETVMEILENVDLGDGIDSNPNIVLILSESYSDLTVLGDIETDVEISPNFKRLCNQSMHGYALSSIYGGNTSVSEWEVLTGNSMAFMPKGSVPYYQYVDSDTDSVVRVLNDRGYLTVGMHPYLASGWNRDKVFSNFGFDEKYFLDSFEQENLVRSYVSDQELYDTIVI